MRTALPQLVAGECHLTTTEPAAGFGHLGRAVLGPKSASSYSSYGPPVGSSIRKEGDGTV
jgi:hypothetical protein